MSALKAKLKSHVNTPTTGERRRSVRKPESMPAWIMSPTATDPKDRIEAVELNHAKHGIAFETEKPVAVNTYYLVEYGPADARKKAEINITRCSKNPSGKYEVAGEF